MTETVSPRSRGQSHQGINPRASRRRDVVRRGSGRRPSVLGGVLIPHRTEMGPSPHIPQSRLASLAPARCSARFVEQFYDDKPCQRCISSRTSRGTRAAGEAIEHQERPQGRGKRPQRRRRDEGSRRSRAAMSPRRRWPRKLAGELLPAQAVRLLAEVFALPSPRAASRSMTNTKSRAGRQRRRRMRVYGAEGFRKPVPKVTISCSRHGAGHDLAWMRSAAPPFQAAMNEAPRPIAGRVLAGSAGEADDFTGGGMRRCSPWPDLGSLCRRRARGS